MISTMFPLLMFASPARHSRNQLSVDRKVFGGLSKNFTGLSTHPEIVWDGQPETLERLFRILRPSGFGRIGEKAGS